MKPSERPHLKPPWSFALIPSYDADPRTFRGLKRGELACFLAIARCMNGKTYEAFPSMAMIGRIAGTSERHAREYVNSLVEKGWLNREPGGGRGNSNAYTFATPTNGEQETRPHGGPGIENENPAQSGHETRPDSDRNPAQFLRKPGHTWGRRTTEQHTTTSNSKTPNATEQPPRGASGVVAAESASEESKAEQAIRRQLLSAGVTPGSVMDELLGGGLTLDEVDQGIGEWQGKAGKGVGILVEELRRVIAMKHSGMKSEAPPTMSAAERSKQIDRANEEREADERAKADAWCEAQNGAGLVKFYDRMMTANPGCVPLLLQPKTDDPSAKAAHIRKNLATELYRFANRGNATKPRGACEHG